MLETYITAETQGLTAQYPVDVVLGPFKSFWTNRKLTGEHAISFFSQSPANNCHAEALLGGLVALAAKEGQWSGYKLPKEIFVAFEENRKTGKLTTFEAGLDAAIKNTLVGLEQDPSGKIGVVPKEGLIKLIQETVQRYLGNKPA